MTRAIVTAATLLVLSASAVRAQEDAYRREFGQPLLRTFDTKKHGGHAQNWAITQDSRGIVYVANGFGVLEVDGLRWRLIRTERQTIVRSVAVDADDRVWVGAVGEIGSLEPDERGVLRYVSHLEQLPPDARDFADVWSTHATPKGVYFAPLARLIRVRSAEVSTWEAQEGFHAFSLPGRLFVRDRGRGLLELVADELRPVPGGEAVARGHASAVLPWGDSGAGLLAVTGAIGLLPLPSTAPPEALSTEIDLALAQERVYTGILLEDRRIALATLGAGAYVLDKSGNNIGHIDKDRGLQGNVVWALHQDREGALWMALDRGLARAEVTSPVTRFDERTGLDGSALAVYRHRGELYATTAEGLFRLVAGPEAYFERLPQVGGQTWDLLTFEEELLVANTERVYSFRGETGTVASSRSFASALLRSRVDRQRVFVGLMGGLASMRREGERWVDEGAIAGITDDVRSLFELPDGRLWASSETNGMLLLTFPEGWPTTGEPPLVERFGLADGLPDLNHNVVVSVRGKPVFGGHRGIHRFDETTRHFTPDPRFESLFADGPRAVYALREDQVGRVWMYTRDEVRQLDEAGAAVPEADGSYRFDPTAGRPFAGALIETTYIDDDGVVWFSSDEGLFRFDPRVAKDHTVPFSALVREVRTADGAILYGGNGPAGSPDLEHQQGALRFDYAAPFFDSVDATRFQVRLEGLDSDWTPWTAEGYREYTNLSEGSYRFRVRARNVYGTLSEEASWGFRILPPWYRTWWAYGFYLLALAASTGLVSRWRVRRLQRQQKALRDEVDARTRELKVANLALEQASLTDQLTGLRNRRFLDQLLESDVSRVVRRRRDARPKADQAELSELVFFLIDIDHFKSVNDRHGHHAGDLVLVQFTRVLREVFRESDYLVRWGGEEFLIVAHSCGRDEASELAERVRRKVEATDFDIENGQFLRKTCSIGFACFPFVSQAPEALTWQQVVELADRCLFAAKQSQRNAWVGIVSGQNISITDFYERWTSQPQAQIESGEVTVHASLAAGTHIHW